MGAVDTSRREVTVCTTFFIWMRRWYPINLLLELSGRSELDGSGAFKRYTSKSLSSFYIDADSRLCRCTTGYVSTGVLVLLHLLHGRPLLDPLLLSLLWVGCCRIRDCVECAIFSLGALLGLPSSPRCEGLPIAPQIGPGISGPNSCMWRHHWLHVTGAANKTSKGPHWGCPGQS